jgi:hypothetical protein
VPLPMARPQKLSQMVRLRISPTERTLLRELAWKRGLKVSQLIRQLIKEAANHVGP